MVSDVVRSGEPCMLDQGRWLDHSWGKYCPVSTSSGLCCPNADVACLRLCKSDKSDSCNSTDPLHYQPSNTCIPAYLFYGIRIPSFSVSVERTAWSYSFITIPQYIFFRLQDWKLFLFSLPRTFSIILIIVVRF